MYADDATLESPKLNLPAELLAEVSRRAAVPQGDFRVDGWKPSLLERLVLASRGGLSLLTGLLGLVTLVGGMVVLLRRRDYRQLRSQYANPDSLGEEKPR